MIKKKRYISEQYEKHHLIFKAKELNLHMFKCTQTFRQRITRNCFTLFSLGRNWASLVAQLAKNLPAGDPSSIPGSGISPGEEIGYPLQYSWASLVVQLVENVPIMREICIWSLGWEEPLEEGMATHSIILAWGLSIDTGGLQAMVHGVATTWTQLNS